MWFNVRVTIRLSLGGLELGIHFHWKTVLLLAKNKGRGKGEVLLEGSEREERVGVWRRSKSKDYEWHKSGRRCTQV